MFTSSPWCSYRCTPHPPISPPADSTRLLTEWSWEWWIALGIAIAAALYIAGLVVLHRRGDRWPVPRSLSFRSADLAPLALPPCRAGTYDTVLFSVHIVQHMILMMVAPCSSRWAPRHPRAANVAGSTRTMLARSVCTHEWPVC